MKLHHIGLVVKDLNVALNTLGIDESEVKESVFDPVQNNMIHFIEMRENNLWLELVVPMGENSTVNSLIKKQEISLHHLAIGSDDFNAVENAFKTKKGAIVIGRYSINVNVFGGNISTLFYSLKGLILEFVRVNEPNK